MKKRKFLFASLCCVAGLAMAACSNGAGKYEDDEPIDDPKDEVSCDTTYTMTLSGKKDAFNCDNPTLCSLELEADGTGTLAINLVAESAAATDKDGNVCPQGAVSGAEISVSSTSPVDLNSNGNNIKVVTSELIGLATVLIDSAEAEGVVVLTVNAGDDKKDKAGNNLVQNIMVTVPAKDKKMELGVTLAYAGDKDLNYADVFLFEGKKCADLLASPNESLTPNEILGLSKGANESKNNWDEEGINAMDPLVFSLDRNENTYAAVARAMHSGEAYSTYGCTDGLSADNANVKVVLQDAMSEEEIQEHLCEANRCDLVKKNTDENYAVCLANNCIEPDFPENGVYTGTYQLQSQFNALSLLPTSGSSNFSEMLAGDWIDWSLDLLAQPEKKVPDIVINQLLPLVLEADWLTAFLEKIGVGDSILALLSPEMIKVFLESFGVTKIIEDSLAQLLGQLEWWDTASSVVTIVDEIATNFTLAGSFMINEGLDDNDNLKNNIHSYDKMLYNTGKFDCYFGKLAGTDVDGNNICSVDLTTLDSSIGSVYGPFEAYVDDCNDDNICGSITIRSHSLQLAYGKLIYGVIMQFLPQLLESLGAGSSTDIHSIGSLIEYYAGYGLVKAWNSSASSWNEEHAADIEAGTVTARALLDEATVTSCNAIATAGANFVSSWISTTSFGELASKFIQPALLTPLCTNGIAKLDALIDSKLGNITTGTDAITFKTSGPCALNFAAKDASGDRVLESFGMTDYVWGQKTDDRCKWQMSIQTKEGKSLNVDGKFFATRKND